MSKSNIISNSEIDLKILFNLFVNAKWFLISISSAFALFSFLIATNLNPTFIAESSINTATDLELNELNTLSVDNVLAIEDSVFQKRYKKQDNLNDEDKLYLPKLLTKEEVLSDFLEIILSRSFQTNILMNSQNQYIDRLFANSDDQTVLIRNIDNFLSSFSIHKVLDKLGNYGTKSKFQDSYLISMTGPDPFIISELLNELIEEANQKFFNDFKINNLNILDSKLQRVNERKEILNQLAKSNAQRKLLDLDSAINRIKEQKEILKLKSQNSIQEKIVELEAALDMAISLGIKKNNFGNIKAERGGSNVNLFIESAVLPKWYLYGSDALSKEIEILHSTKMDSRFLELYNQLEIEESEINLLKNNILIATSQSEINLNNTRLQTLKLIGMEDSDYLQLFRQLEVQESEINILKNNLLNAKVKNAAQVTKASFAIIDPIKPNKMLITLMGTLVGIIFSIVFIIFRRLLSS